MSERKPQMRSYYPSPAETDTLDLLAPPVLPEDADHPGRRRDPTPMRALIEHIVKNYSTTLQDLTITDVFDKLKLRHDQYYDETEFGGVATGGSSNGDTVRNSQKRCAMSEAAIKRKHRIYEAESSDAYFEQDDEDDCASVADSSSSATSPPPTGALSVLASAYGDDEGSDGEDAALEAAFIGNSSPSSHTPLLTNHTNRMRNLTSSPPLRVHDPAINGGTIHSLLEEVLPELPPLTSKYATDADEDEDVPVKLVHKRPLANGVIKPMIKIHSIKTQLS